MSNISLSKAHSGIKMYDVKEPVLEHLEKLNKDKKVGSCISTSFFLRDMI